MATAHYRQGSGYAPGMSRPVAISLGFHAIVILLAIVGIPYIARTPPEIQPPIPVEVVTVAEKTQVNKPAATPLDAHIPKKADIKDPPKPVPPTNTAPEKPTPPKPAEPTKSETKPTPADDALAPPAKELKKVKAPPKKPDKPTLTEVKDDPSKDKQMDALLKNLIKTDPTAASPDAPVKDGEPTPEASLSDQMTMSEMDAVRQQLGECWKLLAGARYAENLVVEIKMTMNPDKTVQNAVIVDQMRYNSDTFFRAAADSALRAVYDPHCNPLQQLPDGKYGEWKVMNVNFDPREMLQ